MSDITIYCPNCDTGFSIPQEAIGSEGRKVKCSQCSSVWFQDPVLPSPLAEDYNDSAADAPPADDNFTSTFEDDNFSYSGDEYDVPAVPEEVSSHTGLKVSFAFLFLLALFSASLAHRDSLPFLKPLYEIIGVQPIENIAFSDLEIYREREANHLNFHINGHLKNDGSSPQILPPVHIKALSKGGTVMRDVSFSPKNVTLNPDQEFEIKAELKNISGNTEQVVIDIGSGLETSLR